MHTFRELVLGAYLQSIGFEARYAMRLQIKTPDWVIIDDDANPLVIVELVNFHIDRTTENYIRQQSQTRPAVVGYWRDGKADNPARLCARIQEKAQTYLDLANNLNLAYVIAVYGEFAAALDADEVMACLNGEQGQLFEQYPHVSGVLFFDENGGGYNFQYLENPASLRKLEIKSGLFSS